MDEEKKEPAGKLDKERVEDGEVVEDTMTPQEKLWHYSRTNQADGIKALMKSAVQGSVDLHAHDQSKYGVHSTALHYACEFGHLPVVKLLFSMQANIEAVNKFCSTPLHIASAHGHTAIVRFLVEQRATLDAKNVIENTPLHLAVYKGSVATVDLLLHALPSPHLALVLPNGVGIPPFKYAATPEMNELIKKYIKTETFKPGKDGTHAAEVLPTKYCQRLIVKRESSTGVIIIEDGPEDATRATDAAAEAAAPTYVEEVELEHEGGADELTTAET
jgi:hypothetical protein